MISVLIEAIKNKQDEKFLEQKLFAVDADRLDTDTHFCTRSNQPIDLIEIANRLTAGIVMLSYRFDENERLQFLENCKASIDQYSDIGYNPNP